jgi:hypothetical protein
MDRAFVSPIHVPVVLSLCRSELVRTASVLRRLASAASKLWPAGGGDVVRAATVIGELAPAAPLEVRALEKESIKVSKSRMPELSEAGLARSLLTQPMYIRARTAS